MPDWAAHVRPRLASLRLSPPREHEIVDELCQHLEDRWRDLVAGGAPEDDASKIMRDNILGKLTTHVVWSSAD